MSERDEEVEQTQPVQQEPDEPDAEALGLSADDFIDLKSGHLDDLKKVRDLAVAQAAKKQQPQVEPQNAPPEPVDDNDSAPPAKISIIDAIDQVQKARLAAANNQDISSNDLKVAMRRDQQEKQQTGIMEGIDQVGHGLSRSQEKFDPSFYENLKKADDNKVSQLIKARAANMTSAYRDLGMQYRDIAARQAAEGNIYKKGLVDTRAHIADNMEDKLVQSAYSKVTDNPIVAEAKRLAYRANVGLRTAISTASDHNAFPQIVKEWSMDLANILQGRGQIAVDSIKGTDLANIYTDLTKLDSYFDDHPHDVNDPNLVDAASHLFARLRDSWQDVANKQAELEGSVPYKSERANKAQQIAKDQVSKTIKNEKFDALARNMPWANFVLTHQDQYKAEKVKKALGIRDQYNRFKPLMENQNGK